ncbi:MAG: N-6 DNA methylase, partial [Deltaproteobacteria bacterium]|nr:N-6 DNA methylase [Deltaproteobacteria bacterium]
GDKDRVDIIVTNPPFGGEEEKGIQLNFPEATRCSETALLFLQLIMRSLKRPGPKSPQGGRCALISSDGLLSTKGVHSKVKADLVSNFNLHTIVRLPKGVFSPYTPIKTNILFFDTSGSTKGIWFYEVPPPKDRQLYTKTKPLKFEELADCVAWWDNREETERAWYAPIAKLKERDMDLDLVNPNRPMDLSHSDPAAVVRLIEQTATVVQDHLASVKASFPSVHREIKTYGPSPLSEAVKLRREYIQIDDDKEYQLVTVQLHARGIKPRSKKFGRDIKTKDQQVLRSGDLVVAEIDAKMGGYGIVPPQLAGGIVSSHYFVYEVDTSKVSLRFLQWFLMS